MAVDPADAVLACSFCFTQPASDVVVGPAVVVAVASGAAGLVVAVRALGRRPVRVGLLLVAIGLGVLVPAAVLTVRGGRTAVELDASYGQPDGHSWQVTCERALLDGPGTDPLSLAGHAACEEATAPRRSVALGAAGLAAVLVASGLVLEVRRRRRSTARPGAVDDASPDLAVGSGPPGT